MHEKLEHYLGSICEQAKINCALLDELKEIFTQTNTLNPFEYAACERFLQILIESGIGLAKQWLKHLKKPVKSDAYSNFEELYSYKYIGSQDLSLWRSAIGLRNALVHEYLEIDRNVITELLTSMKYREILQFILNSSKQIATS